MYFRRTHWPCCSRVSDSRYCTGSGWMIGWSVPGTWVPEAAFLHRNARRDKGQDS
jgi:hypothetical protein